jgi:hypothetical protein
MHAGFHVSFLIMHHRFEPLAMGTWDAGNLTHAKVYGKLVEVFILYKINSHS